MGLLLVGAGTGGACAGCENADGGDGDGVQESAPGGTEGVGGGVCGGDDVAGLARCRAGQHCGGIPGIAGAARGGVAGVAEFRGVREQFFPAGGEGESGGVAGGIAAFALFDGTETGGGEGLPGGDGDGGGGAGGVGREQPPLVGGRQAGVEGGRAVAHRFPKREPDVFHAQGHHLHPGDLGHLSDGGGGVGGERRFCAVGQRGGGGDGGPVALCHPVEAVGVCGGFRTLPP